MWDLRQKQMENQSDQQAQAGDMTAKEKAFQKQMKNQI